MAGRQSLLGCDDYRVSRTFAAVFGRSWARSIAAGLASILVFSLVGQQSDLASALDRQSQFALIFCRDAGDARGQDLAARREEALQESGIFVIDLHAAIGKEGADFAAGAAEAATDEARVIAAFFFHVHVHVGREQRVVAAASTR